jgi:hypothetical protein
MPEKLKLVKSQEIIQDNNGINVLGRAGYDQQSQKLFSRTVSGCRSSRRLGCFTPFVDVSSRVDLKHEGFEE